MALAMPARSSSSELRRRQDLDLVVHALDTAILLTRSSRSLRLNGIVTLPRQRHRAVRDLGVDRVEHRELRVGQHLALDAAENLQRRLLRRRRRRQREHQRR